MAKTAVELIAKTMCEAISRGCTCIDGQCCDTLAMQARGLLLQLNLGEDDLNALMTGRATVRMKIKR